MTELVLERGMQCAFWYAQVKMFPGWPRQGWRFAVVIDRSSLEAAVAGVDRVWHCAARMGPWRSGIEHMLVNVHGTKFLAEAALAAGVQRFVHLGSIDVHGLVVGDGIDEMAPYGTERDPYCRSKIAGECVLQDLIKDKEAPITIVRPGLNVW